MWVWVIICIFSAMLTFEYQILFFPFFANQLHQKYLLKSGYLGKPKE